jgi:pimeloyl-ACP methyl ester carboxylesterase
LPVTFTPTPGARGIVVWPPYTQGTLQWGHVAFLEEVYPDGRVRITEANWPTGSGIKERILSPAQYAGLSFVRLENATPNPQFSSPPATPGQQREYRVRPGDTLWGIAQRELGNGNRWREIQKPGGGTFTEAEAGQLQVGQSVYLPVSYQSGSGTPVTPPPSSAPSTSGNINWVNFSGTVGPSVGVNLRNSPRFTDRSPQNEPNGKRLEFDAWTYGETVTDLWLGTPDARWFKVKGTNFWVPSAYIYGNPPNSSPMPGSGAVGNVTIGVTPIDNTPTASDPDGTLGTAGSWGSFSDRTDSIGFNGDQNDFFRFRVTNNRTNVNLRLSGLSADADLQLIRDLNNNGRVDPGEVLGQSLNPGTSVDSVSRILDSGDYFIRVLPGTSSAKTNYSLSIRTAKLAEPVRSGSADVNLWRYDTGHRTERSGGTYQGIDPSKETVIIIHGWNNSDQSASIRELAKEASEFAPQVLALDWGSIAQAGLDWGVSVPYETASWIAPVALWAKNQLVNLGINPNQLTLIGHSLGALVSSEIARLFGKVKNLVALDPAYPADGDIGYDIDISRADKQHPADFRDVANNSLAFVVADTNAGLFGDNDKAATAHDSFLMRFNPGSRGVITALGTHGAVIDAFTDAIDRRLLTLPDLNLPNLVDNWYDNNGDKDNWLDRRNNPGKHEGTISAVWTGNKLNWDDGRNPWRITGLERVVNSSGTVQQTWT